MLWIKNKYLGILDFLCFDVVHLFPEDPRPVPIPIVRELYSYLFFGYQY